MSSSPVGRRKRAWRPQRSGRRGRPLAEEGHDLPTETVSASADSL